MARIGVLGSTGMLGSALVKVLSSKNHEIIEINRRGVASSSLNEAIALDAVRVSNRESQQLSYHNFDYLVNAIGLIKQLIREGDAESESLAKSINVKFPKWLNQFSLEHNVPIIQIGTDCVFSGIKGKYSELDKFDPSDLYGRSKADGEGLSPELMTIRTSIVGKEVSSNNSLMNWVLCQPTKKEIYGYTNHLWNGVTTLAFSRVVEGVVASNQFAKGKVHLVPDDFLTKAELVTTIAQAFQREDLIVTKFETDSGVNRTLATIYPERNLNLWTTGGYNHIPTIKELITEYANWESTR